MEPWKDLSLVAFLAATAGSWAFLWHAIQQSNKSKRRRHNYKRPCQHVSFGSEEYFYESNSEEEEEEWDDEEHEYEDPVEEEHERHDEEKINRWKAILPSHLEIHVVKDVQEAELISKRLLQSLYSCKMGRVVGLDVEWKPHTKFRKNKAAILQICHEDICVIYQLLHLTSVPPSLVELLQDKSIIKCGVGVLNDVRILFTDHGINVHCYVDLQAIATKFEYNANGTGLASLSKTVLDVHNVDKSFHIRGSNWEAETLAQTQVFYAAIDAHLSREIFARIYMRHGCQLEEETQQNNNPQNDNTESNNLMHTWSHDFIDRRPLKHETAPKNSQGTSNAANIKKYRNPDRQSPFPNRKSPLYENCRMLGPDGTLLCTCNRKKLNWYLDREIADLVCEDPPTIQLKFDPKGKGHDGDMYYLTHKSNKCVVCGVDDMGKLIRHSVIPHSYRKFLEEQYKSRSSHDIVLICQACNERLSQVDARLKEQIAVETGIPVQGNGPKQIADEEKTKIKSRANTLKAYTSKLPQERKLEIENELKSYLSKDILTEQDLTELSNMETKSPNPNYKSHEELVVALLKNMQDVELFIKRWRKNFVDGMKPQHLPDYWSVDHAILHP